MKTQRGFSMIEVVITIAILGILLAAAMPSVSDWIRNTRIRNTAESILNGLQLARMEAVRTNKATGFYLVSDLSASCALSSTSGSWVVSVGSPAGACATATLKGLDSDGGGATVGAKQSDGSTAATSVTFSGLGMLTLSSSATAIRKIAVTSADGTTFVRRVEISPIGLARLCDPLISTSGDTRRCAQ